MIYNDFQDLHLSALGMGCMRLPETADKEIDIAEVEKMVAYAMEHGVNYYDTAWGYHDGKSETVMGEVLSRYSRESFYLSSKFPGYDLNNMGKVQEIFEKQLAKCQTEYFDFYMFHNVCELNIDAYLDPQYRIFEYLSEQKKDGRIRHLGFSSHGSIETMQRFLDAYGSSMEFCLLQLNWLDWEFQNAKAKVQLLAKYNIPVWVMEPLRGGSLLKLADEHVARLNALRPGMPLIGWAFGFLQSIPQVTVTLSGMSNFEQLKENVDFYAVPDALTDTERDALLNIAKEMTSKGTLPCTSCRYCTPYCPQELNIPWLIELYNEHVYSDGGFLAPMAIGALDDGKKPSACIGCRACEDVCPQNIKISEMMIDFTEKLKKD